MTTEEQRWNETLAWSSAIHDSLTGLIPEARIRAEAAHREGMTAEQIEARRVVLRKSRPQARPPVAIVKGGA